MGDTYLATLLDRWRRRDNVYARSKVRLTAEDLDGIRYWRNREIDDLPEADRLVARLAVRGWVGTR